MDRVSIYAVFFAVSLLGRAMRRKVQFPLVPVFVLSSHGYRQ